MTPAKNSFENNAGKGKNAGNKDFPFLTMFLPFQKRFHHFRCIEIVICKYLNSFPNNKILDCSKLKAFADDKKIVTDNFKFVSRRAENIVGKGENA